MQDTSSMSKYNKQVNEKHYLSDLTSSQDVYIWQLFLVYY